MIGYRSTALLELQSIHRKTEKLHLQKVSFELHPGRIMGIIGDDRSGRRELPHLILGYTFPSSGIIRFMGEGLRLGDERIAPILGRCVYPDMTLLKLEGFLRGLYESFRPARYFELLSRFVLPPAKKVSQLDLALQTKLQLAVALSTEAKLLVLTDGLDRIAYPANEELKELLLEFVSEGERAVILTSGELAAIENLISDITFLHEGKQLFSEACDELPREFAILRCGIGKLADMDLMQLVGLTEHGGEIEALVHRAEFEGRGFALEVPTLADALRFSLQHEKNLREVMP